MLWSKVQILKPKGLGSNATSVPYQFCSVGKFLNRCVPQCPQLPIGGANDST